MFITISFVCATLTNLNGQSFYYSFNDFVHLTEVPNHYVLKFEDTSSTGFMIQEISNFESISIESLDASFAVVSGNVTIDTLKLLTGIESVHKKYLANNEELLFSNQITLQFKSNVSSSQAQNVLATYNLIFIDSSVIHQTYSVHLDSNSIIIANSIHELALTEYCYPRFNSNSEPHGYVPKR